MVTKEKSECSISNALAIILFVSRLFGIAPVRFTRRRDYWHVSVSRVMCIYSYVWSLILCTNMVIALAMDLGLPAERSVRVRTKSSEIVWFLELILVMLIIPVGVYGAPKRMTSMIHSLNQIQSIRSKYNKGSTKEPHKEKWLNSTLVSAVLAWSLIIYAYDYYTYVIEALLHNKDLVVACVYINFYLLSFSIILLQLQFVAIAVSVNNAFMSVNKVLKDFIQDFDFNNKSSAMNVSFEAKSINGLIDMITLRDKSHFLGVQSSKITPKVFRDLVLSYGTICDVVREVDRSHGLVLLLLLCTMLLHLVITPFYLFVNIKFSPENTNASLGLQSIFILFHTIKLVLLTEAGHITLFESFNRKLVVASMFLTTSNGIMIMNKTRTLVSHIAGRIEMSDPLFEEIDLFFKQIELNKVAYEPMGMCTLTRQLIASIFGTVTTYLVIILQFQSLDTTLYSINEAGIVNVTVHSAFE